MLRSRSSDIDRYLFVTAWVREEGLTQVESVAFVDYIPEVSWPLPRLTSVH